MLDWVENRPLVKGEILSSLLFLVCKSSRENTRPENMCDIGFEKTQDHAGKVNRMSVNAEK